MYGTGGLVALLEYKRDGNKVSVIAGSNEKKILYKLSDPHNASGSFKELQQWVDENMINGINYHTLNKFVKRKYNAKIKVARKSYVSKDEPINFIVNYSVLLIEKDYQLNTTYRINQLTISERVVDSNSKIKILVAPSPVFFIGAFGKNFLQHIIKTQCRNLPAIIDIT